jgi:hypothetical protein
MVITKATEADVANSFGSFIILLLCCAIRWLHHYQRSVYALHP